MLRKFWMKYCLKKFTFIEESTSFIFLFIVKTMNFSLQLFYSREIIREIPKNKNINCHILSKSNSESGFLMLDHNVYGCSGTTLIFCNPINIFEIPIWGSKSFSKAFFPYKFRRPYKVLSLTFIIIYLFNQYLKLRVSQLSTLKFHVQTVRKIFTFLILLSRIFSQFSGESELFKSTLIIIVFYNPVVIFSFRKTYFQACKRISRIRFETLS